MSEQELYRFDAGRVVVDGGRREVRVDGQRLDVSGRRFDLLMALLQRRDRVAGKDELLQAVWPGRVIVDNNLEVHVAALRAALGREAIATVRGRGYRWTLMPDEAAAAGRPAPAERLIGRDGWLQGAARWLQPGAARIVTLHGAGGVGKTRLASALAARHGDAFADGCCALRLAPVRQAEQLPFALAAVLGLQPAGALPRADQVAAHLKERELLLVLDNAEHLLPELGPLLQGWCAAAPRLQLLLTSRLPLGLPDETVLTVPPLAVPAAVDTADAADAAPAMQLLLSRALAMGQDIGAPERAAAAEICRRVGGLPLALELVAARLRVLSPRALLARLTEPLSLLAGGVSEDPRHRSLADTLAWSVALLPRPAQALFARLGVFVDGWTMDAACAVGQMDTAATLQALDALLEVLLLQRADGDDGEPRYRMLEPVRDFALQRLAAAGEVSRAQGLHLQWYQALVQRVEPQLRSGSRAQALARLRPERANLAAALRLLVDDGADTADAAAALRMTAGLSWAWYFGGSLHEGRQWLRQALQLPTAPEHAADRVRAQVGAAHLSMYLFDIDDALAQGRAALAGARALADDRLQAEALFVLAVPTLAHDPPAALPLWQESMQRYRACGDAWGLALATSCLGIPFAMAPGQEAQAEALLAEGRRLFAELGDEWGMNLHDHYMGLVALRRGDLARARELSQRMLATARALDDGLRVGGALHQLACIDHAAGAQRQALQGLHDAAALHHAQGRAAYAGVLLRQGACWWAALGDAERAARLFGAASVDRGLALPIWSTPAEAQAAAAAEADLRARLPHFDALWHEGRSWTTAQAVAALAGD